MDAATYVLLEELERVKGENKQKRIRLAQLKDEYEKELHRAWLLEKEHNDWIANKMHHLNMLRGLPDAIQHAPLASAQETLPASCDGELTSSSIYTDADQSACA